MKATKLSMFALPKKLVGFAYIYCVTWDKAPSVTGAQEIIDTVT